MLTSLRIQNFVLIKSLEINPTSTLNTITGETGAGKSIMLGALGLLKGNRADVKTLSDPDNKCVIEAEFNLAKLDLRKIFEENDIDYETECILRREITPTGKSRAFINDTPVILETLKLISNKLIDIHSQHETLLLGKNKFQLEIIDTISKHTTDIQEYRDLFKTYSSTKKALAQKKSDFEENQKELDFKSFLLQELVELSPQANEYEVLEKEQKLIANTEEIQLGLQGSVHILSEKENNINDSLYEIAAMLENISPFSKNYSKLTERINSVIEELKDIQQETEAELENIEFDPEQALQIEERFSLFTKLLNKHKLSSSEEIIELKQKLESEVGSIENAEDEIKSLEIELTKSFEKAIKKAKSLSETRKKQIPIIEKSIQNSLKDLGMENAELIIEIEDQELDNSGSDKVNFLFSANKGIKPEDLAKTASGGEFSRLMFVMKFLLGQNTSMPTIIFDEIDTGVSGEVALKMANMMKEMANNHQIITITHLPQVAGAGKAHFFVYKDHSTDKTFSNIKELTYEERINELASMIGGSKPSESAYNSAKELINT